MSQGTGYRQSISARLRGTSARILLGAATFTILSRVVGIARESVMVGLVGVHDYTDAYFALAAVVMWLQNWAFGAFALYFVPKYRSLAASEKGAYFRGVLLRISALGLCLGVLFAVFGTQLEGFLLSGRHVLDARAFLVLALCMPMTAAAGVYYARNISEERGLVAAARSLFFGNLGGVVALAVLVLTPTPPTLVMPGSLAITQLFLLLLLRRTPDTGERPAEAGERIASPAKSSQFWATTAENVGFNLNAIGQQAIAGMLPTGGVTLNAYAVRLLLVPITGLLQPVQQSLLIRFSAADERSRGGVLGPVLFGCALGLLVGGLAALALAGITPFLGAQWQELIRTHRYGFVVLLYGTYAGVVFSNQALARFAFSNGSGWTYAVLMLVAYALGTGSNLLLLPSLGLVSLPLTSLGAEMCATLLLLQLFRRPAFQRSGNSYRAAEPVARS